MMKPTGPTDNHRIAVSIDPDLEEIIPGFLDNRRRDVTTLQAALQRHDLKTIRMLSHRMKGDGGGYGFDAISEIGDAIEQAALREDNTTITEQVAALADYLARVDVVYRR
jgi:HPt (histidine-containing phosphotransfer) domain-containing protein